MSMRSVKYITYTCVSIHNRKSRQLDFEGIMKCREIID